MCVWCLEGGTAARPLGGSSFVLHFFFVYFFFRFLPLCVYLFCFGISSCSALLLMGKWGLVDSLCVGLVVVSRGRDGGATSRSFVVRAPIIISFFSVVRFFCVYLFCCGLSPCLALLLKGKAMARRFTMRRLGGGVAREGRRRDLSVVRRSRSIFFL